MNPQKLTGLARPFGMMITLAAIIGFFHGHAFAQTTDPFVGTWHIKVPTSDQGFPPFEALQTYHAGGTMTEVSSNFTALAETPAQGVWAPRSNGYDMTFQLFVFDSTGALDGRVQVRTFITLAGADSLVAQYAVDFIDLDGNLVPGIDSGPFYGNRIKPSPVVTTSVQGQGGNVPVSFSLEQNYPNPFNPTTNIHYQLQRPAQVSLRIYDVMGREVRTLLDRRVVAGVHQATWDGKDNSSRPVSSGVYYYRLRADQTERAKRMLLVK
jgi:FlgD Ig-like domain